MNEPGDHETSTVERRLERRATLEPPPALRARVLDAVADALGKRGPGEADGWYGRSSAPASLAWLPGTAVMVTALSLLLVTTLSRNAASERMGAATDRQLISFAERAKLAGVTLDADPPSTCQLAGSDAHAPSASHIMRSIDARLFLQGDL